MSKKHTNICVKGRWSAKIICFSIPRTREGNSKLGFSIPYFGKSLDLDIILGSPSMKPQVSILVSYREKLLLLLQWLGWNFAHFIASVTYSNSGAKKAMFYRRVSSGYLSIYKMTESCLLTASRWFGNSKIILTKLLYYVVRSSTSPHKCSILTKIRTGKILKKA